MTPACAFFRFLQATALTALLAGCASSAPSETFSNARSRAALLAQIPAGTPIAAAAARMTQQGYNCGMGRDFFRAGGGAELHQAKSFLVCQSPEKPYLPLFMFEMTHRWSAYFIDDNGKVADIIVDMDTASIPG